MGMWSAGSRFFVVEEKGLSMNRMTAFVAVTISFIGAILVSQAAHSSEAGASLGSVSATSIMTR
ncbi:hypothetical protein [Novosphingobium mangrovi (ex Huang et al. 2023)]|uniref:Uncharacterized protein n=1 Tax=Novosphingobium mangrovi (ex Huang et al. 2023) TaxID=2976432 RepID=A0ABT2I6Q7_9SPHN|nr:hypothetical protein [Novosphingobium mangrovi (ex Huang et al. 2023)]MCT2400485.1 hypothetical protein [Novosphingobium mangrovi (ex Huang et al. 2023)]